MIQAKNLSKQFAGQTLFKDVSFNLSKGEKVGLVGRNGSGKSTLFKILLGQLSPDEGEVCLPKGYRIGFLEQHISFSQPTVIKEASLALPEEAKFDFYKAEKILSGLGFEEEDLQKDPASFSGGFQIRINLCKALLGNPDILLLDEPTNYLDILSLRWLRSFLRRFPGEVILITHDRDFMDSVTDHTMGIHRQGLKKFKGDTHKFYERMAMEEEIHEKTRANQIKKKDHLESFVERFRAKASKATQAQSKLKQLEKMEVLGELGEEASMGLRFRHLPCPGKELLSVKDLSFGYTEENKLIDNFSLLLGPKDRIGIIGKNGKGKSTLLNLLAGELTPLNGEFKLHPALAKGHFGQTNVARLSGEATVQEEVMSANSGLGATEARSICGALMFEGELAQKKIKVLSGGEKNRVMLGKILARPANLLLLDEPTNHLDMESIEILGDEISRFPGALALVTHSESLLRKLVNKLVVFGPEGPFVFDGGYDEFLEKIGWGDDEQESASGEASKKPSLNKKQLTAMRQEVIKRRSKECSPLQKEQESLEEKILELEEGLAAAQAQLEEATKESDNQKILESSRKIGEIEKSVEEAFERMEELETALSEIKGRFDEELENLEK